MQVRRLHDGLSGDESQGEHFIVREDDVLALID
jgi:hypothetical protein